MLRKRTVIESVNDFLKNICEIEHSRHRSITNFLVNLLSALVAYSFLPKKPSNCLPKTYNAYILHNKCIMPICKKIQVNKR